MDYSVGHIIFQLESSNIHFWTSKQVKHSKISSGSILLHPWCILFSALSMKGLNQLTILEIFLHITNSIRDKMYDETNISRHNNKTSQNHFKHKYILSLFSFIFYFTHSIFLVMQNIL